MKERPTNKKTETYGDPDLRKYEPRIIHDIHIDLALETISRESPQRLLMVANYREGKPVPEKFEAYIKRKARKIRDSITKKNNEESDE